MKENNSSFLKHFFAISSGSLINMLLGFISTPIITRLVDIDTYGKLSIYNIYVNIGMFVFCLGLDQALVRYFYESEEFLFKRALVFKCWSVPIVTTTIVGTITIIIRATNIIDSEYTPFYILLIWIGILSQVAYRLSLMVIRLQYKSKVYGILTAIYRLLYVVIAVSLIVFIKSNYFELLVIATILSTFITFGFAVIVERKLWNPLKIKLIDCHVSYKELIKYGTPFIASLGIAAFYNAVDKVCLKLLSNYSEVGIYASATTLLGVFGIVQSAFNSLWSPMAMEHYTKNPEDKEFHKNGCHLITVVMFFFGINLILFKDIFVIILGSSYREAAFLIPFLSFYPIMYTISESTVNGINFSKKSYMHIIIAIICFLVNFAGNLYLIPYFGGVGAAISTGVSYILFFTLRTLISNKYYPVKYGLAKIYTLTLLTLLYAAYNTFNKISIVSVGMYFIIMSVLVALYRDTIKTGISIFRDFLKLKR